MPRHATRALSILLWAGVLVWGPAFAQHSPLRDCDHLFAALARPGYQSSVEIEIGAGPGVMRLFTTEDGTLRPVLESGVHPDVARDLRRAYPEYGGDLGAVPWDALDWQSQVKVLEHAARERGQDFFENRRVPGLKYRDEVEVTFPRAQRFLGREYPRGRHKLKTRDFFPETAIEYMGPDRMSSQLGFELHFRTNVSSGENLRSAWGLVRGLGHSPQNVHQHVVAPIPRQIFSKHEGERTLAAARLAEYYRRVNLYAEMKTLLRGNSIQENVTLDSVKAGNIKPSSLYDSYRHFQKGATAPIGSDYKIGWVGIRSHDVYDGPEKLWGLEFRDLSPHHDHESLYRMLDAAQHSLVKEEFGIPPRKIERWLSTQPTFGQKLAAFFGRKRPRFDADHVNRQVAWSHYAPDPVHYEALPPYLRQRLSLSPSEQERLQTVLARTHERNLAVNMLVKDWSRDPLFFENPEVQERILKVQAQALKRLLGGENQISVMQYFLKRSGIQYMFEKSLGI